MIKAVIFDFFGVICSDNYWRYVKSYRQMAGDFQNYAEEVNAGEISWDKFIAKIAQATDTTPDEVREMYKSEKIDPRMVEWIADLHKNYKTGLITNAHHEFIEPLLQKSHMSRHLDSVVISSRGGSVKPDPSIYEKALSEIGVEPPEAVYFDDLERHVEGAKAVGMKALLFTDYPNARSQLEALLSHK